MENIQTQPRPSLPSPEKLLDQVFVFYRANWIVVLGIMFLPFIFSALKIPFIAGVIGFIANIALIAAVTQNDTLAGGIGKSYSRALSMIFPFAWVSILRGLATAGGTFLLFIPGIVIGIFLTFAHYILFAENKRGFSALLASYAYVKGYFWSVLWRILFLVVAIFIVTLVLAFSSKILSSLGMSSSQALAIKNILVLGFAQFFAIPLSILYSFQIYRSLRDVKGQREAGADEARFGKILKLFMVLGILGILAIIVLVGFALARLVGQYYL